MLVWHIILVVPDDPRLLVTTSHVMPSHPTLSWTDGMLASMMQVEA